MQGNDCVALFKRYISSDSLAQAPLLVLPAARLERLKDRTLQPLPRNPLNERSVKEFRKTAEAVRKFPWQLVKASDFLLDWAQRQAHHSHNCPQGSLSFPSFNFQVAKNSGHVAQVRRNEERVVDTPVEPKFIFEAGTAGVV